MIDAAATFRRPLPPARARALPWATVMVGSTATALPIVAGVPLLPPFGLLMLLTWRLLAPLSLRRWAAARRWAWLTTLPAASRWAVRCCSGRFCFLTIDVIEQRLFERDFWQDWLIASAAIFVVLFGGRLIALPLLAHVDGAIAAQAATTALLFPAAARLVAWIDRRRGLAA